METSKIQETKKHRNNKVITFVKQHKKLFLIGFIAITVIVLACILANAINNAVLTDRVQSYLDGKMFIKKEGIWTTAYTFNKNTMGKECWCSSDQYSSGDINEMLRYKATGSLGSEEVQLWYKDDGKWWGGPVVLLCEDGSVKFTGWGEWSEATIDEINTLRRVTLCKHKFGQDVVIKAATCASGGETSHTCIKCGYLETQSTSPLEHNYKNKICTKCGEKKPLEKSDLKANTWYTYDGGPLHIQNCLVKSAVSASQGKAMSVSYYPVCGHCHAVSYSLHLAGPEVNYEVERIYYCNECGGPTLVRLKIG